MNRAQRDQSPLELHTRVPLPWRWVLPGLVSSYVPLTVALSLIVTCFIVTKPDPWLLGLMSLLIVMGLLGLATLLYLYRVRKTAEVMPSVARFLYPGAVMKRAVAEPLYTVLTRVAFLPLLSLPVISLLPVLEQGNVEVTLTRSAVGGGERAMAHLRSGRPLRPSHLPGDLQIRRATRGG